MVLKNFKDSRYNFFCGVKFNVHVFFFRNKNTFDMYSFFFSGDCNDDQECICVEQELKGDHVKCVSDAVCKMYCQFDQKARTGKCGGDYGWDCVCSDNDEKNEIDGI